MLVEVRHLRALDIALDEEACIFELKMVQVVQFPVPHGIQAKRLTACDNLLDRARRAAVVQAKPQMAGLAWRYKAEPEPHVWRFASMDPPLPLAEPIRVLRGPIRDPENDFTLCACMCVSCLENQQIPSYPPVVIYPRVTGVV